MADEPLKTGLITGVEKREIKIVGYDPDWPKKFQTHAKIIADALGGSALRIEHIGSTSVLDLGRSEYEPDEIVRTLREVHRKAHRKAHRIRPM